MGRPVNQLSDKWIKKSDIPPGLYGDGNGLYLQVSNRNTKAWIFRFMIRGRPRKMGLGDIDHVSLKDARKLAQAKRLLVVDGIDPIEERNARRIALVAGSELQLMSSNFESSILVLPVLVSAYEVAKRASDNHH